MQPEDRPTSVLLPNFIEDSVFDSHSLQLRRPSGRPQVLYAGRIMVYKGCRDVLAASRQLPGVDFTLLGPVMAEMEQYLQDLPPNVILGGDVSRDAVLQKMRESDIFVLFTTHSEGFPMVVVEAMAVGLPVVSTRVGAIPEMIEEGSGGLLVDAHDTAGLVTALRTLAEDPAMRARMGMFNFYKSRTEYAYSVVARQLVSLYERLIENPSSGFDPHGFSS